MTPQLLRSATGCTADAAETYAAHLGEACAIYGIDVPGRLAAFLAQVGHESGGLRYVRELATGEAYEGRKDLGNSEPGDGRRYRGRGLIQITGRHNYRAAANRMRRFGAPDFEALPEELEQPRWAALSAADYWDSRGLNALADAGKFEDITRRINGGLNGQADRQARWERARAALATTPSPTPVAAPTASPVVPAPTWRMPAGDADITPPQEANMPIPAILAALLPSLIDAVPKLAGIFKPGSEVAERNVQAAQVAFEVAKTALGAANEQEVIQRVQADPAAAAAVATAVEANWYLINKEAGSGGIDGARKADAVMQSTGDIRKSASFWVALLLIPLVYLLVLSLIGLIGSAKWSDDVRAGLAGSLISAIVGGLVGYYYGQTTSRNRTTKD